MLGSWESQRPTRAEIDLEAIASNYRNLQSLKREVLCVLKADAYGHGAVQVAQCLRDQGAKFFAVALLEEGLQLRRAGIKEDILIMNGAYGDSHKEVLVNNLTPVIYNLEHFWAFERACEHKPYNVHVKVDTGMHRLGVTLSELPQLITAIQQSGHCFVQGVFTHLSSSDTDLATSHTELQLFQDALKHLESAHIQPVWTHAANSGGVCFVKNSHFNMIRPGAYLYGITPETWHAQLPGLHSPCELPKPKVAMRFRSEVISLKTIAAGESVGYDRTWVAKRPSKIATLPVGYADGIPRAFSNKGAFVIRGQLAPIVGRVSMDLTTVDVTDASVTTGDEALFFGPHTFASGSELLVHPDTVAQSIGSIGYELVTSVSKRVPRIYRWSAD